MNLVNTAHDIHEVIDSSEYKDWESKVKLHDIYDKHSFKMQDDVEMCVGCHFINDLKQRNIIDRMHEEERPEMIKKIMFSIIYKTIFNKPNNFQNELYLNIGLFIMFNAKVDLNILIWLVEKISEKHTKEHPWMFYIPDRLLAMIAKENKLTSKIISRSIEYPSYAQAIWGNAHDKFCLLKNPAEYISKNMQEAYNMAAMIKGGALTIKNKKTSNIFKPLPLLIKNKKEVGTFLYSKVPFLGARLWLAWNFPNFYRNIIKDWRCPFSKEVYLLLWHYKYNKDCDKFLADYPEQSLRKEKFEEIANKNANVMISVLRNVDMEVVITIALNLPLDQFYELSSSRNFDYLHYTVDKYNNLIKMDKVTFPEITPGIKSKLENQ